MMFNEDKYDFINAKVHGMRSKLYHGEKLMDLLSARTTIELIREIYPEKLGETPPAQPRFIEKKLVETYLTDLIRIKNGLGKGKESDLIDLLIDRYNLQNLKIILKFWNANRKSRRSVSELTQEIDFYLIQKAGDLNMDNLLSASDFDDFIHALPDEKYSNAAKKASRFYYKLHNTFYVELAFDVAYLKALWEQIDKLRKDDRTIAQRIYGTEMDWHILSWIWRLRKNYKLPNEQISYFFDSDFYQLNKSTLKTIINQDGLDEIVDEFPIAYRHEFRKGLNDERYTTDDYLWTDLFREARKITPLNLFNLGLIICYTVFKRVELMNLFRLIQGMKYELPKHKIKQSFIPLGDWED